MSVGAFCQMLMHWSAANPSHAISCLDAKWNDCPNVSILTEWKPVSSSLSLQEEISFCLSPTRHFECVRSVWLSLSEYKRSCEQEQNHSALSISSHLTTQTQTQHEIRKFKSTWLFITVDWTALLWQLVLAALLVVVAAAPNKLQDTKPVAIVKSESEFNDDGSYTWGSVWISLIRVKLTVYSVTNFEWIPQIWERRWR